MGGGGGGRALSLFIPWGVPFYLRGRGGVKIIYLDEKEVGRKRGGYLWATEEMLCSMFVSATKGAEW